MRALVAILIFAAVNLLSSQPVLAEKRVALVVGNSAYQNVSRLSNPVHDADAMSATLKAAGFDTVDLKLDLRANEMRRALRDFSDQVRDADVAIVYFAGHGIEVDGMNYLIPTDAVLERDIDTYDEAIALDRVMTVVEPSRKLRLVILDACRDNPFNKTMKRTLSQRAIGRGLAKVEPASPNTLIAFAAKAGSTASDGGGQNSPFTAALIKHLPKPGLDLRKAFGFARDEVLRATNNKQEPFIYGSLGGDDFALVPAKPVAPMAVDLDDRRDYELALQLNTSSAWGSFLRKHPTGFYADLAKGQLDKLAAMPAGPSLNKSPDTTSDAKGKNQESKTDVASLTPTGPASPNTISKTEIIRQLQSELSRVGCYAGPVDGNWRDGSQKSVSRFNENAGLKLDIKTANIDALEAVKSKTARVCPLVCDRGYKVEGEACVKIVCGEGFQIGAGNTCEKIPSKKPIAKRDEPRPAKQERITQEPAVKPEAVGRVMCDQGGCRPVPRGCQVVSGRSGGTDGRLVCN